MSSAYMITTPQNRHEPTHATQSSARPSTRRTSTRLLTSAALIMVAPLFPIPVLAQQVPNSAGLYEMGIGCDRKNIDTGGRLFPDPQQWRDLCEAHRDAGMAYMHNLLRVHRLLADGANRLPPPVLNDLVEYFGKDERIENWFAKPSDISLSESAVRVEKGRDKASSGAGFSKWVASWAAGIDELTGIDTAGWNIRARICNNHLVTYYVPGRFKSSWTPQRIRNVVRATLRDQGQGHESVWTPLLIEGEIGSPTLKRYNGRMFKIPACMDGTEGGGLYASPLPRNSIGFHARVGNDVITESRREACPADQVGSGLYLKRRAVNGVWVNGDGDPAASENDAWTEFSRSCRQGRLRYTTVGLPCTGVIAGVNVDTRIEKRFFFREIQDPDSPYSTLQVPVHFEEPHRRLNAGEVHEGALLSHYCSDDIPRFADPVVVEERREERDPRACNEVYAEVHYRRSTPAIATYYHFGTWDRRRIWVTESADYPDEWPVRDFSATWAEPWVIKENSCHGFGHWSEQESRSVACPSGQSGSITQVRTKTWDMKDYADPARADILRHTHIGTSGWSERSRSCQQNQNRGDEFVWAVDIDGDGSWDGKYNPYNPEHKGAIKGWVRESEEQTGYGPGRVPGYSPGSGLFGGGGGGGGGDSCFLTTAIVERCGEADDGPTLTALRHFRDGWMMEHPDGRDLIKQYYTLAPQIVATIPESHSDWDWIGDQVDLAVNSLNANDQQGAFDIYCAMVRTLVDAWLETPSQQQTAEI